MINAINSLLFTFVMFISTVVHCAEEIVQDQYYLRFKVEAHSDTNLDKLGFKFKILQHYKNSYLLLVNETITKNEISVIRKYQFVESFTKSVSHKARSEKDCYSKEILGLEEFSDFKEYLNYLKQNSQIDNCFGYNKCIKRNYGQPEDGPTVTVFPALMAQMYLGSDLMLDEIKDLPIGHTKVAILDTGMDLTLVGSKFNNNTNTLVINHTLGPNTIDIEGHGTPVTSLYSGNDGVGIAPKAVLTHYKISSALDKGMTTTAIAKLAMEEACDSGNRIINYSFGVEGVEETPMETEDPIFFKNLKEKGCLILKSAGNEGDSRDYSLDDPFDNILKVAALDMKTEKKASKYAQGEVYAPGISVAVITSTQDRNSYSSCEGGKSIHNLNSGSSFANPLTGAILANALGTLTQSKKFTSLSLASQTDTLVKIIHASSYGKGVNGYRAVRMAKLIRKLKDPNKLSVKNIQGLFDKSVDCVTTLPNCLNSSCDNVKNCVKNLKRRMFECPKHEDTISTKNLINTYLKSNEYELALWAAKQSTNSEILLKTKKHISSIQNRYRPLYYSKLAIDQIPAIKLESLELFSLMQFKKWERNLKVASEERIYIESLKTEISVLQSKRPVGRTPPDPTQANIGPRIHLKRVAIANEEKRHLCRKVMRIYFKKIILKYKNEVHVREFKNSIDGFRMTAPFYENCLISNLKYPINPVYTKESNLDDFDDYTESLTPDFMYSQMIELSEGRFDKKQKERATTIKYLEKQKKISNTIQFEVDSIPLIKFNK